MGCRTKEESDDAKFLALSAQLEDLKKSFQSRGSEDATDGDNKSKQKRNGWKFSNPENKLVMRKNDRT